MSSPKERIRRLDEDWSGITDPALRKKLQNKINQRALPRKRQERQEAMRLQQARKQSQAALPRSYAPILPRPEHFQVEDQILSPRRPHTQPTTLIEAVAMMTRFSAAAYDRYYAADPCLDHLFTLSKFNVLRAFVDNMVTLGLSIDAMGDDVISPFNMAFPGNPSRQTLPASLFPTSTQCTISHHPWLDCFPFPRMRDNLVRAADSFNDCELCTDIVDPTNGDIGMMVWGDPWLPQSWEVSQLFVTKWAWVIEGCPEIIVHSNYWRGRRGLQRLKVGAT
ncbi:DUF3425 domain-containing protein [Aspergillus brunneoviolaceus CBS 621.78]|uniref:Uncharacterized protein n=1 Tax=Aspergillus brunneoviolaceus CBS 621.78 TaxID=1450534 RepID=A0ACD1GHJ4_9EURO|nr:hypothetical protein BO95DRAFT_382897 [Aspergillus brunneoviolaceus CBS 621.78]RAH48759.1 hypothetical protein BO95DRAFT_382897 [Aspergillus brunneoviolaceus CBS 621.78]